MITSFFWEVPGEPLFLDFAYFIDKRINVYLFVN